MGFLDETGLSRFLSNLKAWINASGNSATATKLSTARKLKTNLASAADATFDGSAAQESIPVTGVLSVANGGTGSAVQNFVGLNGTQVVAGEKTFTNNIKLKKGSPRLDIVGTNNNDHMDIIFYHGQNEDRKGLIRCGYGGTINILSQYMNPDVNLFSGSLLVLFSDGGFDLGSSNGTSQTKLYGSPSGSLSWGGQPLQTASDERVKTAMSAISDEVLDAWGEVQWGQYQYLEAVNRKGEAARLHLGLIAQKVKTVFEARGLDVCNFGILCHEERPAVDEETVVVDAEAYTDDGGVEHPAVTHVETRHEDAVDLWTVRYDEAQAMEAAFQRRRADRLEVRIAALEERLNGI